MSVVDIQKNIRELSLFRQNMGSDLPKSKIREFWGEEFVTLLHYSENCQNRKEIKNKIKIVEENIEKFLIFDWVKFIGITGSVASGIAKSKDDIDIFIVVRNDRMWLYRGFLALKFGFNSIRRVWGKPSKNKIDTNFICEERGLVFSSISIFVLNELLFMIPVYGTDYYKYILGVNHKLMKNFSIDVEKRRIESTRYCIYKILNFFAFSLQYTYMLFMRHKPDSSRLLQNNRKGRIEFFPKNFQDSKLKEYRRLVKISKLT
jgi:predicted nucleotidyltransferase